MDATLSKESAGPISRKWCRRGEGAMAFSILCMTGTKVVGHKDPAVSTTVAGLLTLVFRVVLKQSRDSLDNQSQHNLRATVCHRAANTIL